MCDYTKECKRILNEFKEELKPVINYKYSELAFDFLGFLDVYKNLDIPNDFVVIDFGCYQAVQVQYFKDNTSYIGVDNGCPNNSRMLQENAIYYDCSIQNFIKTELPKLLENKLNINKAFAICSYVPDNEAQKLVYETFPFHKVVYCSDIISENLII